MLVTKTDGAFCPEREAMLRLRSINLAASGSTRSSAGRESKSSKLLRNGHNLCLTYPTRMVENRNCMSNIIACTNYLCRDPPTNSLTFHYRHHHDFCLSLLIRSLFHSCALFFMMSRWESIRPETIRAASIDKMKYIHVFCLIHIYLLDS